MMRRSVLAAAIAVVPGIAGCGDEEDDSGNAAGGDDGAAAEGLTQGTAAKMAGVGISSPESNGWDRGGSAALDAAASAVGAEPTWLSNVTYDQASQTFDRL